MPHPVCKVHPRIINLNLKISIRPLHELFTFKRNDVLKTRLTGAPRAALHTALTDPFFYLHHPDLKIADIGKISDFIREREGGQWAVHYTSPQCFIIGFVYY